MKLIEFNDAQLERLSAYFSDVSKIVLASTVLNFFFPSEIAEPATLPIVIIGGLVSGACLLFSITIVK